MTILEKHKQYTPNIGASNYLTQYTPNQVQAITLHTSLLAKPETFDQDSDIREASDFCSDHCRWLEIKEDVKSEIAVYGRTSAGV